MSLFEPKWMTASQHLATRSVFEPPNEITTRQLNTLLYVVNLGQQIILKDPQWKTDLKKARAHWRSVSYTMPVARLRRMCDCTADRLRSRLKRFKKPVGDIPLDRQESFLADKMPAPVIKCKFWTDNQRRKVVTITLDTKWCHLETDYMRVDLPLPVGDPARCMRYLQRCRKRARAGGMSRRK